LKVRKVLKGSVSIRQKGLNKTGFLVKLQRDKKPGKDMRRKWKKRGV